jgi:hypothetical protein
VELFFKWITELEIKTSTALRKCRQGPDLIAVSVYVLVAIMKKRLKVEASLYTILQVLSVTIFERMPLLQALTDMHYKNDLDQNDNQLFLFS